MRRFVASLLSLGLVVLSAAAPASAAADKQLQNLKGSVFYQSGGGTAQPVANHASVVIQDNDTASTGANSLGGIELPDSSRILLGANSSVQVASFNQTDIANASFVVSGKVRFKVEHPKGAKANYTFKTATAQIAVRGTAGDIFAGPDTLQVNVYELTDPTLPVQVTLANGQVFALHAGQSLILHFGPLVSGGLSGGVQGLTNPTFQTFTEFGLPANASAIGLTGVLAHFTLIPLITAVIVDTALLTATSHTTTSTVPGPNNTTVPVHVQVTLPIHLPFIP